MIFSIYNMDHNRKKPEKVYLEYFKTCTMVSYTAQVAKSHKRFNSALSRAKTRQACLKAYYSHKKEHEKLLKSHLKQELAQTNRKESKIPRK